MRQQAMASARTVLQISQGSVAYLTQALPCTLAQFASVMSLQNVTLHHHGVLGWQLYISFMRELAIGTRTNCLKVRHVSPTRGTRFRGHIQ